MPRFRWTRKYVFDPGGSIGGPGLAATARVNCDAEDNCMDVFVRAALSFMDPLIAEFCVHMLTQLSAGSEE